MKKVFALILLISITIPACFKKKCGTTTSKKTTYANKKNGQLFSEDAEEFVLEDDSNVNVFESDNSGSDDEISLDSLQERPQERGKTIQFDYNSSKIRPEQKAKINENSKLVKDKLRNNKNSKVVCKGHSCKIAKNKEYNYTLSQERAHRIAKNYENAGVPANQVKAVGFGDSNRVTDAEGIEGQAPNRRVETEILSD
ncbi:MAG: OmpA family protein [Candidatus Babeliales bacterium]|nr:OmpA family protein [Candidatus Babeliales bacterium]